MPRFGAASERTQRLAGSRAAVMGARHGFAVVLLLLAGLPGVVHANKKASGAESAAQWAAKAEAATVAVGNPLTGSGQAAAGPTASASELAAVEAPATTGPGARVGYLKLMETPLTAIDPEVSCGPRAAARLRCCARNPSLVPLTPHPSRQRRLFATTGRQQTSIFARAQTQRCGSCTSKAACGARGSLG